MMNLEPDLHISVLAVEHVTTLWFSHFQPLSAMVQGPTKGLTGNQEGALLGTWWELHMPTHLIIVPLSEDSVKQTVVPVPLH